MRRFGSRRDPAALFAASRVPSDLSATAVDRVEKRRQARLAQHDDLQDRLNERGPGPPTGPRKLYKPRPVGTSRAAILRRLRREFPELHRLVLNSEVTPFAAAVAAGFRKRVGVQPKPGPVDPFDISPDQAQELWLGAGADGSVFPTEKQRREAWTRHRARLMELWGQHGRRPIAWWLYEAGELDCPEYDFECSALFEAGLLTESEQAELLAYWRHEFDRACRPGFFPLLGCGALSRRRRSPRSAPQMGRYSGHVGRAVDGGASAGNGKRKAPQRNRGARVQLANDHNSKDASLIARCRQLRKRGASNATCPQRQPARSTFQAHATTTACMQG
jgi:hypothetical protein